jgi:hypothetical protein
MIRRRVSPAGCLCFLMIRIARSERFSSTNAQFGGEKDKKINPQKVDESNRSASYPEDMASSGAALLPGATA